MNNKKITLQAVTSTDYKFLFSLLKERDPKINISHKKIPTYKQHKKFVSSKPYKKWHIIKFNKIKIGLIYLSKNNEIGIFIKKDFQNHKFGDDVLRIFMLRHPQDRYLANISPKNKKSIKFFTNNGFKLIQYTYELTKD